MTPNQPSSFLETLRGAGVVAVIRAPSADAAVATARALVRGGIGGIEITFSTPGAADVIARVREELPQALIGAGTVLEVPDLLAACRAGAAFLVSPHLDERLIDVAREHGVPFLPGAFTPTEVVRAWRAGAACVKLFPGSALGPSYLKALRAPLPDIPLMPTGGVDESNLHDWLSAGALAVGMGGRLAAGTPAEVEAAALRVRAALDRFRLSP